MVKRLGPAVVTALALMAASATSAAMAAERLGPGQSGTVSGGAGEARSFPLALGSGDYVRGGIAVTAGRFDVDLVAADGRVLRRLASGVTGAAPFQFVAAGDGPSVRLTATETASRATISFASTIPPVEQKAPPTTPLSPRIAALVSAIKAGGATDDFWAEVGRDGAPLVEPGPAEDQRIVTFLWRGAKRNVRLFGAPSGDHDDLERIGDSDVWFRCYLLPASTRFAYKLAPDVPVFAGSARERRVAILATAQADPFNPRRTPADAPDAFNAESLVELPDAPEQPGLDGTPAPAGALTEIRFASERLGNVRRVTLYRPAGFDPGDPRAVLLVLFDAEAYLTKVPTPVVLDRLIAAGRLPPISVAFVSPIDQQTRERELPANDDFADAMAEELLPTVRRELGFAPPPERTALAGSSYGGLAAATIALRRPEAFGVAISLSGSFWWSPPGAPADRRERVAGLVAQTPRKAVRFRLTAGLFEGAHAGAAGILETSRHLRDVLEAKGYDVGYREYAGGHDYVVWRGALADALISAFAPPAAAPAR